jgi:integrase
MAGVRESTPVRPVPEDLLDKTIPLLPPALRDVARLQLLSGMRPGEVLTLMPCNLETSGPVWLYRPDTHKTAHIGKERCVPLGPQCQEIIRTWLPSNVEAYLFDPSACEERRNAERRAKRKSPVTPSQEKRRPTPNRKRPPTDHYLIASYRRAVRRACERAFPLPEGLKRLRGETKEAYEARLTDQDRADIKAWRKDHHWHPHQLRHSAATRLRKLFGAELARIVLGHSSLAVTEIYAERDLALAMDAAAKVG